MMKKRTSCEFLPMFAACFSLAIATCRFCRDGRAHLHRRDQRDRWVTAAATAAEKQRREQLLSEITQVFSLRLVVRGSKFNLATISRATYMVHSHDWS